MAKNKRRGPRVSQFKLNCVGSQDKQDDWTALDVDCTEVFNTQGALPQAVDLREDWWTIRHQGSTGACVGFATADGLLRWLYVKEEMIEKDELTSPRFIWMANKETDYITRYPTSFLDSAGTSTKLALKVAKKYGCVLESMLKIDGPLSQMNPRAFFTIASQYRINAYYNLFESSGDRLDNLKHWIAHHGPVLTRLDIDNHFEYAQRTDGFLERYNSKDATQNRGHAVCLVGYTPDHFIVRNSWGEHWGDGGFAYTSYDYTRDAFTEAYGAILKRKEVLVPAKFRKKRMAN